MRVLRYWRFGLGAAVTLSVSLAFAADPYPECTRKPTPADVDGAKGAHKAASQFYDRGDYEKAVRYWTDAYSFDCTAHGVLLNIANAYEKSGDKPNTITALETYLKRTGGDATIEEKVKRLKASLQVAPPPTPSGTPTVAPTGAPTIAPTAPPPAPDGPRPYGFKPWIVVGAGGAVALVGAILAPVGLSAVSAAAAKCTDPVAHTGCPDSAASEGNSGRIQAGVGWGMLGVGLVAAVGGLVWQFAFNKAAPGKPVASLFQVLPVVHPTNSGFVLNGAF